MKKNLTFVTDILCQILISLLNTLKMFKIPGFLFKIQSSSLWQPNNTSYHKNIQKYKFLYTIIPLH